MTERDSHEVTQLLRDWSKGDKAALEQLAPLVQAELHRRAHHYMRQERPGHALQTTALVNEAYLQMVDQEGIRWQDRAHFFAAAAQVMRHVLVDYARRNGRAKRGGDAVQTSLDEIALVSKERAPELIALDQALSELAVLDPRKTKIVELRYFGGLTIEETAEVLKVSPMTIRREWRSAKAWLYRRIAVSN